LNQPGELSRHGLRGAEILSGFLGQLHGEDSGGFTMKEPKLNELEIDQRGTRQIRRSMAKSKAVKITINIDKENLEILRDKASKTGVPYQRLLSRLLAKALQNDKETESLLARLEREVTKIKKKVVA
jgi:predicted DNA binding CopG/RHH family protein